MATAEELLSTVSDVSDKMLVVDLNTRVITIPATITILGVESDDDTNRLYFNIPRYYGEYDLSSFNFQINFRNANGDEDLYIVDDVEVLDTTSIVFSWLVDRTAFSSAGNVEFGVSMVQYSSDGTIAKELNTAVSTLPVRKGVKSSQAVVENNPSAFDCVLYRLYAVEAATGLGAEGYYSIVKIAETEDDIVLTVINQDGKTQATLHNGKDGSDGYTPVYGVDYWTSEERAIVKNEILTHAESYIASWAPTTMIATLTSADWTDNRQIVTVEGVTADNIVIISPEPEDYNNYNTYVESGIRCIDQRGNQLKFECVNVPTVDLVVNVVIYYGSTEIETVDKITVTDDGDGNVLIS